ncbi:2463_t:CDS:2 [Acaulospora morrowiae]|uniref:2463_t:CDS:1 n=1 Tax=Acaulospora morrowiae TaxID=94023 RepID=A0A9N9GU03_9GLOM|nr:2463_t:CDS:2 [Acaulospora morrowiae]
MSILLLPAVARNRTWASAATTRCTATIRQRPESLSVSQRPPHWTLRHTTSFEF